MLPRVVHTNHSDTDCTLSPSAPNKPRKTLRRRRAASDSEAMLHIRNTNSNNLDHISHPRASGRLPLAFQSAKVQELPPLKSSAQNIITHKQDPTNNMLTVSQRPVGASYVTSELSDVAVPVRPSTQSKHLQHSQPQHTTDEPERRMSLTAGIGGSGSGGETAYSPLSLKRQARKRPRARDVTSRSQSSTSTSSSPSPDSPGSAQGDVFSGSDDQVPESPSERRRKRRRAPTVGEPVVDDGEQQPVRCSLCKKQYQQHNSFYKHLYEHHPFWGNVANSLGLSKHAQVMVMQSAEVLLSFKKPGIYGDYHGVERIKVSRER